MALFSKAPGFFPPSRSGAFTRLRQDAPFGSTGSFTLVCRMAENGKDFSYKAGEIDVIRDILQLMEGRALGLGVMRESGLEQSFQVGLISRNLYMYRD